MGLPKTCFQISAPVAKSAAAIPHPEPLSDSDNVHLSLSAHGHHYFFPSRKSRVNHRFWGAAAHGGGSSIIAFNGNSLLRSHGAEQGEGGGFWAAESALCNASVSVSSAQAGSNPSCRSKQYHQQQKCSSGKQDVRRSMVQSWVINCPTSYLQKNLRTDVSPG